MQGAQRRQSGLGELGFRSNYCKTEIGAEIKAENTCLLLSKRHHPIKMDLEINATGLVLNINH